VKLNTLQYIEHLESGAHPEAKRRVWARRVVRMNNTNKNTQHNLLAGSQRLMAAEGAKPLEAFSLKLLTTA